MKNNRNSRRILLDTSFLLPTLGIGVEERVINGIRRLHPEKEEIFYSNTSLLECMWLATKLIREGRYQDTIFRKGILSITKAGHYAVLHTNAEDYLLALNLYKLGHRDMIDNLLYATALNNACWFLTIDRIFQMFIENQNIENMILTPETL